MKFTIAAVAALATAAVADWAPWGGNPGCLDNATVEYLISSEILYLQHNNLTQAREIAYSIFTPEIQEFGDSINSLRYEPLGSVVEANRTIYVNDTLSEPGTQNIVTVDIVYNCRTIVWQWQFYGVAAIPNPPNPRLSGFTLIKTNSDNKIYYQYVEFNSLAWAENFGFTVTPPTSGPFAPGGHKKRTIAQEFTA